MSRTSQRTGKRFEQKVAAAHPLFRRYTRKSYGESAPDVLHPMVVIECKSRAKIVAIRFLEQAESYINDGRVAWVVMKEANKRQSEWVVMMRFNDALALLEFAEEKCGVRGESCTE